ncbi:MAG: class I SAM-dependent methyltransferase [Pseudomonadota bacterium]
MSPLNQFMISRMQGKLLDYGCGVGAAVRAARATGRDVVGCDAFTTESAKSGLDNDLVFEMRNGIIPFKDNTFDGVYANQVFEHVADLEATICEIARVLKPGGKLLASFPVKECLYENHVHAPLAALVDGEQRWRVLYAMRMLGFGRDEFKAMRPGETPKRFDKTRDWADYAQKHLEKYLFYRPRREIFKMLAPHFSITPIEHAYVRYRYPALGFIERAPFSFFAQTALRALRTDIIECTARK